MKDNVLISVCIPTFNRCNVVINLCNELLKIKNNNFNVVILDNNSTDATYAKLKKIKDPRLFCFKNDVCIGGSANTLKSIFSTTSKYTLLCNDRDKIDIIELEKLINFLKHKEFSIILTSQKKRSTKNKSYIITHGIKSLLKLNFCYHPTGIIFNNSVLKTYFSYSDLKSFKNFPYCYALLLRKLCMYKDVLIYDFGLWKEAEPEYKKDNISKYMKQGELWFNPYSRYEQYIEFLSNDFDNIKSINYCKYCKWLLIIKGYRYFSRLATLGYMVILGNETECLHYQVKLRNIKFNEIMQIFRKFSKKVFNDALIINNCNILILKSFCILLSFEILFKYVSYKLIKFLS